MTPIQNGPVQREPAQRETRSEKRRICWESVFPNGTLEALCPVCGSAQIRYSAPCGNTFQKLHIVPRCKGGSDESWNLLPGCGCNQNISTMNLIDWMGTKGNKCALLKPLFLAKYKTLVPPVYRSASDERQLIEWIRELYQPEQLEQYEDWLLLSLEELAQIGAFPLVKSPYFLRPRGKKKVLLSGKTIY